MYDEIYEKFQEVAKDNINRELFNNSTELAEALIEDIKNNKIVIYTAFTGGYDSLKEPEFIDENCDYVCFTDNPDLTSDTWKIIQMEDSNLDNNRKAKQYKVLPHKYFPNYKYSFWLDGTFKIKGSLREYIYKNIKVNSEMLCVVHTERDCIYEEYMASKIIPRYPRAVMEEQILTYKKEGFPYHYGLGVMGSIFRQHNSNNVIELMESWWEEIIKFTNQDQLSFAYVCWKHDFHPSVSLIYYWENEYWAKETAQKDAYHHNVVPTTPIVSDTLINNIRDKVDALELGESLEISREELYLLINDVKGLSGYRTDTIAGIDFLNKELEKIYTSNSMKVTKPLRAVTNLIRQTKHRKTIFIENKLKNLEIINFEAYIKVHPDCQDVINHFINVGSRQDSLEVKQTYIDSIFDLAYYVKVNYIDSTTDPLIHFITEGFSKDFPVNPKGKVITSLDKSVKIQFYYFTKEKIKEELVSNYFITDEDILRSYISFDQTFDSDTIKVGVFLEDFYSKFNACPYIRIISLFKELSKSENYHFFIYGQELLTALEGDILKEKLFDVIVIQRLNYFSTKLLKQARRHGIKIIYETDDKLVDIDSTHPSFEYLDGYQSRINRLIDNCDAVTVSTNSLAEFFQNKDVTIIKNYHLANELPFKEVSQNNSDIVKIGYFGTITHDEDLKSIENVFSKLKNKGCKFKLEVVGAVSNNEEWFDNISIPNYPMPMDVFLSWLEKNTSWDIGIVPLVLNDFNQAKSELKFIEFTALGVPVIASPTESYKETINDGIDGFIAQNEDEWVEKLQLLIENPNLRKEIVTNARDKVLKKYDIQSRVNAWDNLFKRLIS